MKNKITYLELFRVVEKAVQMAAPMLLCSECGKGFYKVNVVELDEPDFICLEDKDFKCDDHILYDLMFDPETTTPIMVGRTLFKGTKKVQVQIHKVNAQIFIPNRNN